MFSIVAALTIGYTVFARVLGNNEELMASLQHTIDELLPGLLKIDGGPGLIAPESLIMKSGLTATSIISAGVLLWAALSSMGAIRRSTRTMFDLPVKHTNMALAKAIELLGFTIIAVSVLVSAVASLALTAVGQWAITHVSLPRLAQWTIPTGVIISGFVIDALVFMLVMRVLSSARVSWKDQLSAAALAALGFGVIRQAGTLIVAGSINTNVFVGSVTVVVTLLLWVNLSATIYLLGCAWAANPSIEALAIAQEGITSELIAEERAFTSRLELNTKPRPRGPWILAGLAGGLSVGVLLGRRGRQPKKPRPTP